MSARAVITNAAVVVRCDCCKGSPADGGGRPAGGPGSSYATGGRLSWPATGLPRRQAYVLVKRIGKGSGFGKQIRLLVDRAEAALWLAARS